MKSIRGIVLFLSITVLFVACDSTQTTETDGNIVDTNKSVYYLEVMQAFGKDFCGLGINDDFKEVKQVFKQENLIKEETDFLFYKFSEEYTVAEFSLYFKNYQLSQIALDVDLYDEKDGLNTDGALQLFKDLKEDLVKQYGSKYIEDTNEYNSILYWSDETKEIQLIKNDAEVHVYIDVLELNK